MAIFAPALPEQLKAMGDNERGSVLSAARTQTQWLDSDKIHPVLAKSDFTPRRSEAANGRRSICACRPRAWRRMRAGFA